MSSAIARRRHRILAASVAAITALLAPPLLSISPHLVWNATASAPIGLYAILAPATARTGDMVLARTPASVRALAAARRYIPSNVPLIKRIAAGPGDTVCAQGFSIAIDGRQVARRRAVDGRGRALPWWIGCRTLKADECFLLMAESPDSFDGRYFGPVPLSSILGRATLLWRA
jgi:conjugative transfer signal peptidase TraF